MNKSESRSLRKEIRALARGVSELISPCFGPFGRLYSLLPSGRLSKKGNEILEKLNALKQHHCGAILLKMIRTQLTLVGDGTLTTLLLAMEFIERGAELEEKDGIHPQLISEGFQMALEITRQELEKQGRMNAKENDENQLKRAICFSAINTKLCLGESSTSSTAWKLAEICCKAVELQREANTRSGLSIVVHRSSSSSSSPSSSLSSTHAALLFEGVVLMQGPSTGIEQVYSNKSEGEGKEESWRVLLTNNKSLSIEAELGEEEGQGRRTREGEGRQKIERAVTEVLNSKVQVVFTVLQLSPITLHLFALHDLVVFQQLSDSLYQRLYRYLAGSGSDSSSSSLGTVFDNVNVLVREADRGAGDGELEGWFHCLVKKEGCSKESGISTLLLQGETEFEANQLHSAVKDGLAALLASTSPSARNLPLALVGGGQTESLLSKSLKKLVNKSPSKTLERKCFKTFARSLKVIPRTLLANHTNTVNKDNKSLNCTNYDSLSVKFQALLAAVETASLLLRMDQVIRIPPSYSFLPPSAAGARKRGGENDDHRPSWTSSSRGYVSREELPPSAKNSRVLLRHQQQVLIEKEQRALQNEDFYSDERQKERRQLEAEAFAAGILGEREEEEEEDN